MPDVSNHRDTHRPLIQCFGGGRPPDPAAIVETGVLGYFSFPSCGASEEEFSDPCGKLVHILAVKCLSPGGLPLSPALSDIAVGQALLFRFL
jgi:hypothetical protein